ncbi:MAG: hypothetical protein RHS_1879 [Robinsoniella sp. RHS]|uniref:AraC family transcriptional regulator n=1 Tax=Robinsoniella sp. RHS TaxID=1504536 RepID=UPI00064A0D7C|nr:MAG: hypothetical protein RHS_1879 [Robinsoniella sp. RHS]
MRKVLYSESIDGIMIDRVVRDYEFTMPSKHTHDEYEIYYLVAGERYYFIEKQTYHIKKGSLVFINRNQIHKTGQYGDSYHERIVIEFLDEPFSTFLASTGELSLAEFFRKNQGVLQLDVPRQKYVLSLLDGIADEMYTCDPGYRMMTMTKLARLLFFAMRHWSNSVSSAPTTALSTSATHQKVSEVASFITANYDSACSLAHIADHFYMSKSYLSRIFKEITGYTVNEYINVNRIQQARILLAETDLSITEIAERLGYESITYFEKIFRKHTETSPLKYRKQFNKSIALTRPKSFGAEIMES